MEPLEIRKYPDGVLRKKCIQIEKITDREIRLFEEMLFTMRHFAGIGLAAPQIGIAKSLIVADIGEGAIQLANPKILKTGGSDKLEEGCLSIPGVAVNIERPYEIIASGLNENSQLIEIKAKGFLARVLQHEIDHLRRRLVIDYLNLLEKFKFKNLDKIISGSFISTSGHIIGSQGGKTCCGRDERCDTPPCSDGGVCRR